MLNVCRCLMPGRLVDNLHDAVKLVTTTLSDWSEPWLLVFDNLDNLDDFPDVMQYFPDSSCGCILITSRSSSSKDLCEVIEVEQIRTRVSSFCFLARRLSLMMWSQNDPCTLELAITLVRAYISK